MVAVTTSGPSESADAAAASVVDLRGALCVIDGFPLLAGVDLTIDEGEVVLVSGANGAGKTSLLRLLAGVLPLTGGTATVLGADLRTDRRRHRHRAALVGQESGCYDDLTVARNLRLHALAARGTDEDVDRALRQLGLEHVAGVAHSRLSTGQRRRCTLAVGLARAADLLLLDEPHAGLDADGRDLVDAAIATAAKGGATVLVVSHELDRARALCDREVVMSGGRVVNPI